MSDLAITTRSGIQSSVPRRWAWLVVALAVGISGCTGDGASEPTTPGQPVTFQSTGTLREGWYWLEDPSATARWEFTGLPEQVPYLPIDVQALLLSEDATLDGATLSLEYGQGPTQFGVQTVTLSVQPAASQPEVALASGTAFLQGEDLPDDLTSLWVEANSPAEGPAAFRLESLTVGTPGAPLIEAPVTRSAATPPPGNRIDGDFTTNGDLISDWWWVRDSALTQYARWDFPSIPNLAGGTEVQFYVLATDGVDGAPGVDAAFYLTYGFTSREQDLFAGGETTLLVTVPNVSPEDDPVGYTAQGSMEITAAEVPPEATGVWFGATRSDPTGTGEPTTVHVAFNASSVGVIAQPEGGTGDDGGGGLTELGQLDDPDGQADADSWADADRVGNLDPGTYQGTLDGEDDDWFAFYLAETQIVDVAVAPAGGLTVAVELLSPTETVRRPKGWEQGALQFTQAAGGGDSGRWYLHLARLGGNGSYTFSFTIRDANDALRGIDAPGYTGEAFYGELEAMAVGAGDLTGDIFLDDPADRYALQADAGQTLTVTLESLSGNSLELQLYDADDDLIDSGETYSYATSTAVVLPAADEARTVKIQVGRLGDTTAGGNYRLRLALSGAGECSGTPIEATRFTSSGSRTAQHFGQYYGWYWLGPYNDQARSQWATWIFDTLPNDSEVRVIFDLPIDAVRPSVASLYAAYGLIGTTPDVSAAPPHLVTLRVNCVSGTLTGCAAVGEIAIPYGDLAGADRGWWVRTTLVDPTETTALSNPGLVAPVGLGTAAGAVTLCAGAGTTDFAGDVSGPIEPPAVSVSYDAPSRTLESDVSMFVDPATDIDGDGLNQNWENAAIQLANPIVEVDEQELWLNYYQQVPTVNFVEATLWPSYANPQYVVLGYATTWGYDPGGGVTQPVVFTLESHRGDAERVWEAWRIVDSQHARLEWVNSSAHGGENFHGGVWHASDRQCNVANVAERPDRADVQYVEAICANLGFDDQGRLVVFASQDKHAVYPTREACEDVTLVATAGGLPVWGEDCGWDPAPLLGWSDDDFDGGYQGGGRWLFNAYNVGEPGYELVDLLDEPTTWHGLTAGQVQELTGAYPTEAVWSGHDRSGSHFCGGLDAGEELPIEWAEDPEMPENCTGELAGVFMRWAPVFLDALAYTYRVTLQTGTETAAGTNDQIVIELRDGGGTVLARRSYLGDLENGVTDIVYLKPLTAGGGVPGEVASVIIRRSLEIGLGGDWYLASVTVDNLVTGQSTTYPVNQWIEARTDYELS